VMGLTRQLAVEFGPRGVRVNAICPGLIVKPSLAEEWGQPTQDAKKRSAMLKAQ
jgi:NAD(P)-dependent dehydrogenase (short-subunit alcohol dehydrogenase family)